MSQLTIKVKNNYGRTLWYPECNISRMICRIAGTKTLSEHVIRLLEGEGYTFKSIDEYQF